MPAEEGKMVPREFITLAARSAVSGGGSAAGAERADRGVYRVQEVRYYSTGIVEG